MQHELVNISYTLDKSKGQSRVDNPEKQETIDKSHNEDKQRNNK